MRRFVLSLSVVVALGVGCQCVSANLFHAPDVAKLSSCPAPDRIAGSDTPARPTAVAWVGRYQRTSRHPEFVEIEYRFVETSNLSGVLSGARRGVPMSVGEGAVHDTDRAFFVRLERAMDPERWPEVASPWPMALWAGDAVRDGSRTVLRPTYHPCEVRVEPPVR